MAKYVISWEDSVWYDLTLEADSREEALEKFASGDYNDNIECVGNEIMADTIEVSEL